jgi:broad specificity phosphatase PhoE
MGTLFLVRHAQASFLEQNYDKLSPLGEAQARLLGDYWAQRNVVFDRACVGPRIRQKGTASLVSEAFENKGLTFPPPQELPEFDEYQGEAVLERSLPELVKDDHGIRNLRASFHLAPDSVRRRATFQKLFEAVIGKWVQGEIALEGIETWKEFRSRVNSGISKFLSGGRRGERVAIFTSGGPTAVAVERALQLTPERTLQVSWMSRNSSWSEFLYDAERFTLSSFNSHGHIVDPAMLTYR